MTEAENEPVDYRQIAAVSGALHRSAEEDLVRVQTERDAAIAEVAVIRNLAMEHMDCSGCPTPWWLKQALGADRG